MSNGNTKIASSTSNLYLSTVPEEIVDFFKLPLGYILEANPSFLLLIHVTNQRALWAGL